MFDPTTRVLVIDDMLTMRKIVKKTLAEMGFKDIQEAAEGNLAWDVLTKSDPPVQLVVSDWNMPNCSGLELLKKVRAHVGFGKIPFILLTAEAEAHQIKEAISSGASSYILKPFTPADLKAKLLQVYKNKAA